MNRANDGDITIDLFICGFLLKSKPLATLLSRTAAAPVSQMAAAPVSQMAAAPVSQGTSPPISSGTSIRAGNAADNGRFRTAALPTSAGFSPTLAVSLPNAMRPVVYARGRDRFPSAIYAEKQPVERTIRPTIRPWLPPCPVTE